MTKKATSLSELSYNLANFFGATNDEKQTKTFVETALTSHKKHGNHIVLIVSNGVKKNIENISSGLKNFRILDQGIMHDKPVLLIGNDRSAQIYQDTTNCINRAVQMKNIEHAPVAAYYHHQNYQSDTEMLQDVANLINTSKTPTFSVACLNETFLSTTGEINSDLICLNNLIKSTEYAGTLFLMTSTNVEAKEHSCSKKATTQLKPLVPFLIVAGLLKREDHSRQMTETTKFAHLSEARRLALLNCHTKRTR